MPQISRQLSDVHPLVPPPDAAMRARANSATTNPQLLATFPDLRRCDKSENDLESFTGGMPMLENRWIDKREIAHRYNAQVAVYPKIAAIFKNMMVALAKPKSNSRFSGMLVATVVWTKREILEVTG